MDDLKQVYVGHGTLQRSVIVPEALVEPARAAMTAAFPDEGDVRVTAAVIIPDSRWGATPIIRDAAGLEVVDGVVGFWFDMSGTAEFTPTRALRGQSGVRTSGEGAAWSVGWTLADAMRALAIIIPVEQWSYVRVDPGLKDVRADTAYGR